LFKPIKNFFKRQKFQKSNIFPEPGKVQSPTNFPGFSIFKNISSELGQNRTGTKNLSRKIFYFL